MKWHHAILLSLLWQLGSKRTSPRCIGTQTVQPRAGNCTCQEHERSAHEEAKHESQQKQAGYFPCVPATFSKRDSNCKEDCEYRISAQRYSHASHRSRAETCRSGRVENPSAPDETGATRGESWKQDKENYCMKGYRPMKEEQSSGKKRNTAEA